MDVDKYLNLLGDVDEHAANFRTLISECSLIEFRVMDLVAKYPDMCLNDISGERSIYQQGVGRLAQRLQRRGMVNVVKNERDGRSKRVVLTPTGLKARAKCRRILEGIIS